MRIKRLHTNSKIFFPNPYMVRIEYLNTSLFEAEKQYRKIIRSAYKLINGTWGYSALDMETWATDIHETQSSIIATTVSGFNQVLSSVFNGNFTTSLRGYVCFAESEDALQFRLSISDSSKQVVMWPKKEFTIHEVVEVDES